MYLLFAVASVASTTALGADVFLTLRHYIRDVKDTPHHIEELVAELASTLVLLDHFKTLIEERHSSALETIADWAEESRVLLASCKQTFEQIQSEVERTLKEEKSNVGQKVIGAAGKEETQRLKGALDKHQQSIRLMMATIIRYESKVLIHFCHLLQSGICLTRFNSVTRLTILIRPQRRSMT